MRLAGSVEQRWGLVRLFTDTGTARVRGGDNQGCVWRFVARAEVVVSCLCRHTRIGEKGCRCQGEEGDEHHLN